MFPLEFRGEVNREETKFLVMGLSSSEDRMILAGVVNGMIPACVRRSDGQTESIIGNTALCIASYADAL